MSEQARRMLVRTLYTQPTSLAIGAINGILSSFIAAYVSKSPVLYVLCAVLSLIAVARVVSALGLSPDNEGTSTRKLELIYEIGAFSYANCIGVIASVCMWLDVGAAVEVLMIANALCYGVGICARNAGRPIIALGQLLLVTMPILIVSVALGSLPFLFLAVNMALLIPAMASITLNVFKTLRESIVAAEKSADLADKMQILARTDVVTGLANRAGLNHELAERMMAIQDDEKLAAFWLDLDRFKEVNDLLGHPVGDKVLSEVAQRLREVAPAGATISRFGGDEFIVLAPVTDRTQARILAGRILEEVTLPLRIEGERIEIRSSIGIAILPEDGDDADTLMQSADVALYHAKVNGRNQICFFDESMTRNMLRRREIEAELRLALQRDELSIFFQPIVDLATGRIRTFEALVRWFHPEKGEMRPDEFIPVAEETGVIVTLGNWITAQAAKACAQWPEDVTIAVNLSPLQIKAPGAALGILNALREAKLDPSRLELEVTESLFLDDSEATVQFIEELSGRGVRFALDDFGTGYSSLGYINKFPFKKIKVDRSFVSGDNVGLRSDAIIHAVAEMGSRLEMDIVAEGIETIDQVKSVRDAGCTLGQGYYFSRAVPDYLAAMLLAQERGEDGGMLRIAV